MDGKSLTPQEEKIKKLQDILPEACSHRGNLAPSLK